MNEYIDRIIFKKYLMRFAERISRPEHMTKHERADLLKPGIPNQQLFDLDDIFGYMMEDIRTKCTILTDDMVQEGNEIYSRRKLEQAEASSKLMLEKATQRAKEEMEASLREASRLGDVDAMRQIINP